MLLFIGTIATVVYLVKKERIANPLDRLKEKLGKKKPPIAPEKGAAELAPTAAPVLDEVSRSQKNPVRV